MKKRTAKRIIAFCGIILMIFTLYCVSAMIPVSEEIEQRETETNTNNTNDNATTEIVEEEPPTTEPAEEEEKPEDVEEEQAEEEDKNQSKIEPITEDMIIGEWITEDGEGAPVVFLDNGKALITNIQGERSEWEWWVYEDKVVYRRNPESKVWFYYYSQDTDSLLYEDWPPLVRK